ncbi:MAG: ABC transporter substrate-binding protein [Chromatiales bacterium]|nr:ABC transporter substrate-binding protein [Chromatiales bacterium]
MGATGDTIKFAINEWTGQHVSTHIAGETLRKAGYKVEYVTAGYEPQLTAIADGQLHVTMEIWSSNVSEQYAKLESAGKLEDLGVNGIDAREGFLYPIHVKAMCPGLPDWNAMKACAQAFATAETIPNGRLLDYPADWGTPGADRMKGLGLPFKAIPAGSEGALVAELKASVAKKSPLFMVFWQPHWALAEYETEWVALPKADPECFTDAKWGSNPNELNDCDFAASRVFKAAWSGVKGKWPAAHAILKAVSIDTTVQQDMMAQIDQKGADLKSEVAKWMAANASTVDGWVAAGK